MTPQLLSFISIVFILAGGFCFIATIVIQDYGESKLTKTAIITWMVVFFVIIVYGCVMKFIVHPQYMTW